MFVEFTHVYPSNYHLFNFNVSAHWKYNHKGILYNNKSKSFFMVYTENFHELFLTM